MPLNIEEFVIQARFEDDTVKDEPPVPDTALNALKEDIIDECMEKLEEYLHKREKR